MNKTLEQRVADLEDTVKEMEERLHKQEMRDVWTPEKEAKMEAFHKEYDKKLGEKLEKLNVISTLENKILGIAKAVSQSDNNQNIKESLEEILILKGKLCKAKKEVEKIEEEMENIQG